VNFQTTGKISRALEVPVGRLFAAEKKEKESFYRLSKEDLLILKKAVQILGRGIGR
jgi:hypothetical protein